jgi:hypothetical protein
VTDESSSDGLGDDTKRASISVLVPAWNVDRTLERAVRSVLDQGDGLLECIVIDDGSTDGTRAVALRLRAEDGRVVLVGSDANEGVSGALNRGLDVARGEWLTFLGADDRLLPDALRSLSEAGRRDDALVVVGQRVWWDGEHHWVSSFYDIPDIRDPGRKSIGRAPGLVYYASATGKLFHRSVTQGLRYDGRVLGDQSWAVRAMIRAGDRLVVIRDVVYEWTRLEGSGDRGSITTSTRSSADRGLEAVRVAERAFHDVRAEADRLLPPDRADEVAARYAERLLRSDLGMHLLYALRRRDPGLASLFAAIEGFVRSLPPQTLAASDALAHDIAERPLMRWANVPPAARPAYWSLLGASLDADPALARRDPDPIARLALAILGHGPDGLRRVVATALLRVSAALRWLPRRIARRRRQATASTGGATRSA